MPGHGDGHASAFALELRRRFSRFLHAVNTTTGDVALDGQALGMAQFGAQKCGRVPGHVHVGSQR